MTTRSFKLKFLSGIVLAMGSAALVSSCGGGGGGGETPPPDPGTGSSPATIDTASVNKAITDFGGVLAVCTDGTAGAMQSGLEKGTAASMLQARRVLAGIPQGGPTKRALALGGTPPADQLGNCGGRWGYRNYTHASGVTNATLAFEQYCTRDSDTGQTQTTNGNVTFVNTATPTASGPITTRIDASSTGPLTTVTKKSDGTTTNSQTLTFKDFSSVVGVPGGTPTAAKPDVLSMGEITVKNELTGKSYRQSNYAMSYYETAAGNTEITMKGRGYRSDGSYYEIDTPVPLAEDKDGNIVGGQMTFKGAGNAIAVATMVPGADLQVKVSVNGTPITSVPACKK